GLLQAGGERVGAPGQPLRLRRRAGAVNPCLPLGPEPRRLRQLLRLLLHRGEVPFERRAPEELPAPLQCLAELLLGSRHLLQRLASPRGVEVGQGTPELLEPIPELGGEGPAELVLDLLEAGLERGVVEACALRRVAELLARLLQFLGLAEHRLLRLGRLTGALGVTIAEGLVAGAAGAALGPEPLPG